MARDIYIVEAHIVDSNGSFNFLSGYPKTFDSKNYGDDLEKTRRRAEGDFSEVWGGFCKRDDRTIQTVTLCLVDGYQLDRKSTGEFPADATPEQSEE